jgi:hypothetical protein
MGKVLEDLDALAGSIALERTCRRGATFKFMLT